MIDLEPLEEIRPIEGFPNYWVTSFGRVISGPNKMHSHYLELLPDLARNYYQVTIHRKGLKIGKRRKIHILVAQAFITNPENLPEVNHVDGVKTNNHKDNLEWSTNLHNIQHSQVTGLKPKRSSIYWGVHFSKNPKKWRKPWVVQTTVDGKQREICRCKSEIEAAQAYNSYIKDNNLPGLLNEGI